MTHMERVGIREMRRHLSRYAQRARAGESFLITDRGSEVAQLVPAPMRAPAADLELPGLRSLDALHLAAAVSLGEDFGNLFCYDARLSAGAVALGIDVRRPG